ncbi:hypothetical protein BRARA_A00694 [Brassica rapa]|uniref:Uncharacterized protein n=1 Tax=Brassica campestris TaxID=3711 RepID=A0A398AM44_BRACM|nr:hypothetical protein BRARA_A00694 [Brassica rapa]
MEYGEFMFTTSLLYLRKQISFQEFLITNLTPMSCLPSNDVLNEITLERGRERERERLKLRFARRLLSDETNKEQKTKMREIHKRRNQTMEGTEHYCNNGGVSRRAFFVREEEK